MAQIVFSEVGAVIGQQALPNGLSILGRSIAGSTLGRKIGAFAGQTLDAALFADDVSGPRLASLNVMESREGAGIPLVYGRLRVAGEVIWAARFKEQRRENGGSKGGPSVSEYRYSVSFAVGIGEGPITGVDRVWANGEPLDLATLTTRLYTGSETQDVDPLIEAIEGADAAPAYRGLSYMVFEDMPLGAFGNRLPQLSFEVVRAPGQGSGLSAQVQGINIIPASGEFAYSTDVISTRAFPGIESPLNSNATESSSDFIVSLRQLTEQLPSVNAAALTVAWFGDDLRAEHCTVRPCVETRDKDTVPWPWLAGDVGRADARIVSSDADGRSNYGGTPADWSVIQAIQALSAEGIAVTMSPFLLMDVPAGNGLPDPYGGGEQGAFPWRGRITSLSDQASGVDAAVSAFLGGAKVSDYSLDQQFVRYFGDPSDWGYRRFVLHLAWLAKAAGGVSGFLLGSELRGLTRLRNGAGDFPFVSGLMVLAADVRSILGDGVEITYAADWTEYGAFTPADGSGDVLFPLDPLWAHPDIDLVAVDWYPPMGDWREGDNHLDSLDGYSGPGDPGYLRAQFEGGEAFDWYYASEVDRDAQFRTPINDTWFGEHWIYRPKDIQGWWSNAHYERVGGTRAASPTQWVPGSKNVRLAEIGFPAVDKGTNSPNLFYDPKSAESALPPYSTGERDDVLQRAALESSLAHYRALDFVDGIFVWCWDARPFPAFPSNAEVWGDGENWAYGHWLNGRVGLAPLKAVVEDLGERAGLVSLDTRSLDGVVEGFALDGVTQIRRALEPLRAGYGFDVLETEAGLAVVSARSPRDLRALSTAAIAETGPQWTETLLDRSPGRVTLTYADLTNGYQPGVVEARRADASERDTLALTLPLALSAPEATRIAKRFLDEAQPRRTGTIVVPFQTADVVSGDLVTVDDGPVSWRVVSQSDGLVRTLSLEPALQSSPLPKGSTPPEHGVGAVPAATPELIVIDGPPIEAFGDGGGPLVAAAADPWPGDLQVRAGRSLESLTVRASLTGPALLGRLLQDFRSGPLGRWDRAAILDVEMSQAGLSGLSPDAVLSGQNHLLIETSSGWELLAFEDAVLLSDRIYRLTGLLRGLQGTQAEGAVAGARCVFLDAAVVRAAVSAEEFGDPLIWDATGAGLGAGSVAQTLTYRDVQSWPWSVAHLRRGGNHINWIRRGPEIGDSWYRIDSEAEARYRVEWSFADGSAREDTVEQSSVEVPAGAVSVTVAEIAASGPVGPRVPLSL